MFTVPNLVVLTTYSNTYFTKKDSQRYGFTALEMPVLNIKLSLINIVITKSPKSNIKQISIKKFK